MKRILWQLSLLVFLIACAEPLPQVTDYTVYFAAVDDRDHPVEDVAIRIGSTQVGRTGPTGALSAQLRSQSGTQYPLEISCPPATIPVDHLKEIVFREPLAVGQSDKQGRQMRIRLVCARQHRVAAVLVHAGGQAGLPVLVDGVFKAHTGPKGFAHLRLDNPPNQQFQVAIDSSSLPELIPSHSEMTFTQKESDELYVYSVTFATKDKPPILRKKHRKRRRKPKVRTPQRPVRIN